nr:MAG TPA: hypothetical protein [Caudoviricetes sp.]
MQTSRNQRNSPIAFSDGTGAVKTNRAGKIPSEQITAFQSRSELYTIKGSVDAAFYIFRAFERR